MEFDERHVAWLRAMIEGREEDMRRVAAELAEAGSMEPLIPLLHYAFSLAVRKTFAEGFTRAEVVQMVADLRARLSETPISVNPVAAESEIRRALGDPELPPLFPDSDVRWVAQTALLGYLVHGRGLDQGQNDDLIRQSCRTAAGLTLSVARLRHWRSGVAGM